jgi:hypothetical protein
VQWPCGLDITNCVRAPLNVEVENPDRDAVTRQALRAGSADARGGTGYESHLSNHHRSFS